MNTKESGRYELKRPIAKNRRVLHRGTAQLASLWQLTAQIKFAQENALLKMLENYKV